MTDLDLEYLRDCLLRATIVSYPWEGEDRNIGAFRSKEELIAWYCQPPGLDGEPYRDRAFYTRELAFLSRAVKPRTIVEFGTCQGIGTCLLHWLNPDARLITVDISDHTFMPGNQKVPTAHLAHWNGIPFEFVRGNSNGFRQSGIDLCFIDGDHTYDGVMGDSTAAWINHSKDHPWAIVWHDHNDKHPGVMHAVRDFCVKRELALRIRPDSDTVWIVGE